MSLKSDQINRQSFSHRICDDLCEVLLSYLSFEDKIQFECISKQFQRCVYNKQNVLQVIHESEGRNNLKQLLSTREKLINLKAFESVLKKCKFINQIKIDKKLNESNSECVLQLITKYCNHLKEIEFNFNEISEQTLRSFGEKCGQKLLNIGFYGYIRFEKYNNKYKSLLRLSPNCIELNKGFSIDLRSVVHKNEILVPKLRKIEFFYEKLNVVNIELIETFINTHKNTLKSVKFQICSKNSKNNNVLMQHIMRLKSLEELKLIFSFRNRNNVSIIRSLEAIGSQCNHLKRLELSLMGYNPPLNSDIINTISYFKQLKYLKLKTLNILDENNNEIISKQLKDCKNLTHLTLDLCETIKDNFFINIDLFLPQLKYLDLITYHKITDNAMNSLSKLSKLQYICLRSDSAFNGITDVGVCDVISNCLQIKSINLNSRPNITHKTIDALIALALRKPRIQFKHHFKHIGLESGFDIYNNGIVFTVIDLKNYNFPHNMIIKQFWSHDIVIRRSFLSKE